VPRLNCTFREFIFIIEQHGFVLVADRTRGSHRIYRREAGGRVWAVTVAYHNPGDEIRPATLSSMIRQSGLPKELFRK
jgi:predicted RNA binding protein YcfA (HicA-like mRNA interferase family)